MLTVSEELAVCRTELQSRTAALQKVTQDREQLAKDKAALEVRLNSADRSACGLAQELLALRSGSCLSHCVCVCVCLFLWSDL